jgi:hypothetical protein
MENSQDLLAHYLREQIALEESLCRTIDEQVAHIEGLEFQDARELLGQTSKTLAQHYVTLNDLLESIEVEESKPRLTEANGVDHDLTKTVEPRRDRVSKILRDDYSALNRITISNTLLHTTALALDSDKIATAALEHLSTLAPLVVAIGSSMPNVVAREIYGSGVAAHNSIADKARENIRRAWKMERAK